MFSFWLLHDWGRGAMDMPERTSSRELDALFDQVPVALAFFDPEMRYLRTNAELRQMAGLTDEEIIGRRPSAADEGLDAALLVRKRAARGMRRGAPVADGHVDQSRTDSSRVLC